ncbi:MAG: sulfotransferase [Proteobacteria bacterium]|nr:MAG: sulfotransferase [Pseudomonadota bacterium]
MYNVWKTVSRHVILALAFWMPAERRIRLERWLRGREEFRKLGLADAVIVSYGKAGRTWLRVMISRYLKLAYGLRGERLIGFDNFHKQDARVPRLFFTHDNYLRDYTGAGESRRDFRDKRVVLLVRNPQDTAVSQYFQWKFRMRSRKKGLNQYPDDGADVSVHDFVMRPESGLPKILAFMNAWAEEIPQMKEALIVRYEDMRADPIETLRRVVRFLGCPDDDAAVRAAVEYASVENMRKLESEKKFWLSGSRMKAKDESNPDSFKVRRAKVGGYRDYFDDEQIARIDALVAERLSPLYGYDGAAPATARARAEEPRS